MLDMLEISHLRDVMPGDLSTGMKRAVSIARALAAKPERSSTTSRRPWSIR